MDYDSFLELVQKRRSIRKFKPDPVPDDYVDKIIEAARYAPSGANTQPWEFVVVKKQELKDKIIQIITDVRSQSTRTETAGQPQQDPQMQRPPRTTSDVTTAPVFILLLGDMRARAGLPRGAGQDDRKWQSVLTSSLASAFVYMHLAATSLGLASQWQSGVERPEAGPGLRQLLGIPEEMQIYDMMVVGYPDAGPAPKLLREKEKMVHYDFCGIEDFRTNQEVEDFISRARNHSAAASTDLNKK